MALAACTAMTLTAQQPPAGQQPPAAAGAEQQPPQGRGGRGGRGGQPPAGNQTPPGPGNQTPGAPGNQTPAGNTTPAKPEPPKLNTKFVTSKDGTKIAYDVTGSGPALMLLHGAGQSRRDWHDMKYVNQLSVGNSVITVDIRGRGESDKPTRQEAYHLDRLIEDFIAVADAAGAKRFHVWGFAYGGVLGRYLANRTDRVISLVYMSVPFGPALDGPMRAAVEGLKKRWQPVLDAHHRGEIKSKELAESYRAALEGGIPISVATMGAMLEYPPVEPSEMKVPTLWFVGSQDPEAMKSVKAYEGKLGPNVTVQVVDLNHSDTQYKTDAVLPKLLEFTVKHK